MVFFKKTGRKKQNSKEKTELIIRKLPFSGLLHLPAAPSSFLNSNCELKPRCSPSYGMEPWQPPTNSSVPCEDYCETDLIGLSIPQLLNFLH